MKRIIATPSYTKEILAKHHLQAKKNYGQNFLVEPSVVEKIARHAVISDHTITFEIGPGIGALTQYLCEYSKQVVAFEIDERLPDVLKDTLYEYGNVEVVLEDFLKIDLSKWVNQYEQNQYDIVVAANLPYYITTPILFKIFEANTNIKAITVMMQKEVADRFRAVVNTKDYNALSVITQYLCNVKLVMQVPKLVFMPKPQVDSSVLQFTMKKDRTVNEAFFEMVKACFKQRRKTILNNYGEYLKDKEQAKQNLMKAHIDSQSRAESLTLDNFLQLYEVQS